MLRGLVLLAIVGCYNPTAIQPCTISCVGETDCADGLRCLDGLCKTTSGTCGGDDAMPDLPIDAGFCFGRPAMGGLFQICVPEMPTGSTALMDPINTDSDGSCLEQSAAACVIVADKLTIDMAITALGTRPLVLIGATGINLTANGSIDAASTAGRVPAGAGSRTDCLQGTIDGGDVAGGSPGGAGGSYGALGGTAGTGGGNAMAPTASGVTAAVLGGGCLGGRGGLGGSPPVQAAAGRGGGVVYMIAPTITLAGTINASGDGGGGGLGRGGGGGGGSGGLIGFDAPSITFNNATLFANGGGGGEGGSSNILGDRGDDPGMAGAAAGGAGKTSGGDGGIGSSNNSNGAGLAGTTVTGFNLGGGGGGGGSGHILFIAPQQHVTCTNCSPVPTQPL